MSPFRKTTPLYMTIFILLITTLLIVKIGSSELNEEGGEKIVHKEEILNSLPKMPEVTPQPQLAKLQIGIKKRVDDCERKAQKGDILHMHYKGSVKGSDKEFDNSYQRGNPLTFTLGVGSVIKGWDQGLLGICAGEKRKLVIPPHLGYGDMGSPPQIPPSSTLVFEVEAVKVESANARGSDL